MKTEVNRDAEQAHLGKVRAVIENVLKEFDVCGMVILAGRAGTFENFTDVRARWSSVRLFEDEHHTGVMLTSNYADYPDDPDLQFQHLSWSVAMVQGMGHIAGEMGLAWMRAGEAMDKAVLSQGFTKQPDKPKDAP